MRHHTDSGSSTTTPQPSNDQPTLSSSTRRYCSLGFMFTACLFSWYYDSIFNSVFGEYASGTPADIFRAATFGCSAGVFCFLAVIGGLYGSSWIDSFLTGCCGLFVFFVCIVAGSESNGSAWPDPDVLVAGYYVPGVLFAAIAPLLLMRHFMHWRLVQPERIGPRIPTGLGSIMIGMVVIAGVLLAVRAPQVLWNSSVVEHWAIVGIGGLVILFASAIITLPMRWILNDCWITQLVRIGLLGVVTTVLVFSILFLFVGSFPGTEFYSLAVVCTGFAVFTLFVGIRAIRIDGLRLQLEPPSASATQQKPDNQTQAKRWDRIRMLVQVTAIVTATIGLNVYLARFSSRRATMERTAGDVLDLAKSAGGEVDTRFDDAISKSFGGIYRVSVPRGTDRLIQRIVHRMQDDLSGFQYLDLRNSFVTDRCLSSVGRAFDLVRLEISNTDVTGRTFAELQHTDLRRLEARNLDLRVADWTAMRKLLSTLHLKNSQISSKALAGYLRQPNLRLDELELSGVELDDEMFNAIGSLARRSVLKLDLSHTKTSDQQLAKLADGGFSSLNLTGTKVTDASLDTILSMKNLSELYLDATELSEAAAARITDRQLDVLSLARTNVSGARFADWRFLPKKLDLSGTNVDDAGVGALLDLRFAAKFGFNKLPASHLNLAETQITDAVLPKLVVFQCTSIAINGTRLTAKNLEKEIINVPSVPVHEWEIDIDQFTPQERVKLEAAGMKLVFPE